MTITARTLPYRTHDSESYICGRCGITRSSYGNKKPEYCIDCKPEAIALGWAKPPRKPRKATA